MFPTSRRRYVVRYGGRHVRIGGHRLQQRGISPPEDDLIETTELPAWQRVQDINLKSVYLCCRAALRTWFPRNEVRSSTRRRSFAVMGSATSQISHTASKGGVLAMSRNGVQFARRGIRVNVGARPVNTRCSRNSSPGSRTCGQATDSSRSVVLPKQRSWLRRWRSWRATTRLSSVASTFLVDGGIGSAYVTPGNRPLGIGPAGIGGVAAPRARRGRRGRPASAGHADARATRERMVPTGHPQTSAASAYESPRTWVNSNA